MESRTLDLNVISAKDLKDVNLFSKMDVYAVVSISGDPQSIQKTTVDRDGGTSPSWNFPMKFTIAESAAHQNSLSLLFKLRCDRSLGDKDIGEVSVPVKDLLDSDGGAGQSMQFVSYQVRKPSGKPKGTLNFSYKFGQKFIAAAPPPPAAKAHDEPITAYPAQVGSSTGYAPPAAYPQYATGPYPPPGGYPPPPVAGYGYPPPPSYGGYPPPPQQGYGYPPQQGYGYPPVQQGYGYPPVQQAPKKNRLGMGLGAGLLGGALGGLLIGDMVSDAGAYDSGYDAGFDDAGGF